MIPRDDNRELEVQKKKLTVLFPLVFICAIIIIIAAAIIPVILKSSSSKNGSGSATQTDEASVDSDKPLKFLAVIKDINDNDKTVELLNIQTGEAVILNYTGGTEIYDKYKQATVIEQLNIGEMVDAYYTEEDDTLVKLQISPDAWEYKNVEKWSIDSANEIFKIVDSNYQYTQKLVVISQGTLISLTDLNEQDELTVKGHDKEIWSILVTRGHGTIRLEDYNDFVGGTVYVGNKYILPVTKDMVIPVREGNYEVILENGNLMGSKQVDVGANQEVVVNMGEYKKPNLKTGLVTFHIKPQGADLYIDDKLTTYDKAIKLEYGEHSIHVVLGGYSAYAGYLAVSKAKQTFTISLAEAKEDTKDTTSSTNTNTSGSTTNNTGTSTKTNTSDSTENSTDNTKDESTTNSGTKASGNYVYITAPAGASVYLEGSNYKGQVPVSFPKEAGTFHITLIKSGYATQTYTVEFKDDGKDTVLKYDDLEKLQTN